jgi:hypothetical protein
MHFQATFSNYLKADVRRPDIFIDGGPIAGEKLSADAAML